jgi:hypothetical protein
MTEDRRIAERRRQDRRAAKRSVAEEPSTAAESESRALVPVEPPAPEVKPQTKSRRTNPAGFAAQILGQGGQKRGLRGGPETLDRARSTYLETEWSGHADRRPRPGKVTKTEI